MKQLKKIIIMLVIGFLFQLPQQVAAVEVPYYTFTSDSQNQLLRTQTAYTPSKEVFRFNGERLRVPEHVFVDQEDRVYVTDSELNKVFVLNDNLDYSSELTSDEWSSIKSTFVTEEYIYVVDAGQGKIFVYDKEAYDLVDTIGKPNSPVFNEGYPFNPTHIAVDVRGNIYVRGTESSNGLMMLNREGDFITFFGANPIEVPLLDQVRSVFLTETQRKELGTFFPNVISDVAVDQKGFVYTATSSVEKSPVKKFNVSGTNYFPTDLIGDFNTESIWVGQHDNVYTVTSDGWIYEYDSQGQLLFLFGGRDTSSSRSGILSRPISIAANSADQLLVVDQGAASIQVYNKTNFTSAVHQAMESYQKGNYIESQELWEYTLQYNSVFDNSHIGLGNAYIREGRFEDAYQEFYRATNTDGMSEAFWELRQVWLGYHLNQIFVFLLILLVLFILHKWLRKRFDYSERCKQWFSSLGKYKFVDNVYFIFEFLKAPLDGVYVIKKSNRVSKLFTTFLYLSYALIFLLHSKFTSILFMPKNQYIFYELSIIAFLLILWLCSNYLICSISDGEGTFTQAYNGTAYAMTPILFVMPIVILLSNGLTLEQSVFYYLPQALMFVWIIGLLFFTIKDLHNYEVGETFRVVFKSIFTMLIIGLFLFVLYTLGRQLIGFVVDVITEVGRR